jgi:hypothetical protein
VVLSSALGYMIYRERKGQAVFAPLLPGETQPSLGNDDTFNQRQQRNKSNYLRPDLFILLFFLLLNIFNALINKLILKHFFITLPSQLYQFFFFKDYESSGTNDSL